MLHNSPQAESNHEPTLLEKARLFFSLYSLTLLPHDPKTRPHWNEIIPGLILGGIPIETSILGKGDHGNKLIQQCQQSGRPLSLVVSAIEKWELEGKGMGFIRPVSQQFWADNQVNQHHIEMQDFTGNADLTDIKKAVDEIHQARSRGESAYVHCKAGRGRSYLVIFCYLMEYEGMDANQALTTIYNARSQVSPSGRQFSTIEQYRQEYCPERKALNMDSDSFYPYRKDLLSFFSGTNTQGLLVSAAAFLTGGFSLAGALVTGLFAKYTSGYVQHAYADYQKTHYLDMLTKTQNKVEFEQNKIDAFNDGFTAATSWKEWAKSFTHLSAYTQYDKYASGLMAGKEHDEKLRTEVNKLKIQ